jgi:C_GCAxxG_C_C family probable redox protein
VEAIRKRLKNLRQKGFGPRDLDWVALHNSHNEVLDRVQCRAEEYEYLTHSCAKGSALALMEEFGLGNWDIIRAMSPFPGFGMTGGICGGVTGSLIALGLFFGSDDPEDYEGTGRTMEAARQFIARFKAKLGTIMCPDLQEDVIFGQYMDPRASQENFAAFKKAQGYEKCALPPGVGARLAAEIILANNDQKH